MALLFRSCWATIPRADRLRLSQELTLNTEVVQDKSKAKRRRLERALQGAIKEKNILPKDAFRVEHLNYKVSRPSFEKRRIRRAALGSQERVGVREM